MSLANTVVKQTFSGDGSNVDFAIPYAIIDDASQETQVFMIDETDPEEVTVTLMVEGELQDYTLTGANPPLEPLPTTVTMNTAPSLTQKILIMRVLDLVQPLDLIVNGQPNPAGIEKALDRVTAICQQLEEKIERAILQAVEDAVSELALPSPVADNIIGWRSDGVGGFFLDNFTADEIIALAGGVPIGGLAGDVLSKASDADADYEWVSGAKTGWSQTLNKMVTAANLSEALDELFDFDYVAPTLSFTASGSTTIREKGDEVMASLLTATVTKTAEDITAVRFYQGASLLDADAAPDPSGGTFNYAWGGSFSDNTTFSVQVDDAVNAPAASASRTFSFVYPYYVGAGAVSLAAASVAALTKRIIASSATRAETITATAGQVLYFAYPASYGALTSILDANNFETISDWTLRTENITGLDSSAVSYRIYEFNNPVVAGDYTYTFKR